MDTEAITVIVTVVLAVFAIIWHQQRSTEKLRDEFNSKTDKLHDQVIANGQQLALIMGFLQIGIPADAVATEPLPPEPASASPAAAPDQATKPATSA